MSFPARGEVYFVDFDPVRGSEQGGIRPALIVSNDIGNERSSVVTVVPLTRTIPKKPYPQNVPLPTDIAGLDAGTVLCGQVLTVAKERLKNYVASLDSVLMGHVGDALAAHLDL